MRKEGFKDNPSVLPELVLVEEKYQFSYMISIKSEDLTPHDLYL